MPVPEYVSRASFMVIMSRLGFRPITFDGQTITFLRLNDGAVVTLSPTPDGDFCTSIVAEDLDTSLAHQDRLDSLGEQFKTILSAMHIEDSTV